MAIKNYDVLNNENQHVSVPFNYTRGSAMPLDNSTLWTSFEEAQKYANGTTTGYGVPFVGQIITVSDSTKGVSVWKITDTNGTLEQIDAQLSSGDISGLITVGDGLSQNGAKITVNLSADSGLQFVEGKLAAKIGSGIEIIDGAITAQKLSVDQDFAVPTSTNPVSTKAVSAFVDTKLTSYIETKYANALDVNDKLMKKSEVSAMINTLDVSELTLTQQETLKSIKEEDGKIVVEKQSILITDKANAPILSDYVLTSTYKSDVTDDLKPRTTTLENQVNTLSNTTIPAITADVAGLKVISSGLSTRLGTAESEIDGLQTISATHDAEIEGLKTISSGLSTRLGTAEDEIAGLQTISSGLSTRLGTAENEIAGLQGISATHDAEIEALKTISATQAADIAGLKDISSGLSTRLGTAESEIDGLQTISSGLSTRLGTAEDKIAGLQAISASQDARLTAIEDDYVKNSTNESWKNTVGLSAASATNVVVTKKDISDLAGAMHFMGVTTSDLSTGSTIIPVGASYTEGRGLSAGDIVINATTAKEFVYAAGKWNELGDEKIYLTKAEYETWKTTTLENRLTAIEDVESDLTGRVGTLETQVNTLSNTTIPGVVTKLSSVSSDVEGLKTISADHESRITSNRTDINTISVDLSAETIARKAADAYISGKVDNKVFAGDYGKALSSVESLSVIKIAADDYHALVKAGTVDEKTIYIVSSDNINAYGEKITNVGDATVGSDAVNLSSMQNAITAQANTLSTDYNAKINALSGNALTSVVVNNITATVANNVATFDFGVISCGNAS